MPQIKGFTSVEKSKLKERGFFIKEIIPQNTNLILYTTIIWIVGSFGLFVFTILGIGYIFPDPKWIPIREIIGGVPMIVFTFSPIIGVSIGLFDLYKNKYMLVVSNGIIWGGKYYIKGNSDLSLRLSKQRKKLDKIAIFMSNRDLPHHPLLIVSIIFLFFFYIVLYNEGLWYELLIILMSSLLFGGVGIWFFLKKSQAALFFNFLALCLRFQELSMEIQSASSRFQIIFLQKIQHGNGYDDMHMLFNRLSEKFNKVIDVKMSLEELEKKIDKGDFFDAKQSIGLLANDILSPLLLTRNLLVEHRDRLLFQETEKQKLLGEENLLVANTELQSVRSSEIKKELDANIEKLNVMIAKFG